MQATIGELKKAVGFYLGWTDLNARPDEDVARVESVVHSGVRQYLYPRNPATGDLYRWSFMAQSLLEIPTVSGQAVYQLPDNFGSLQSTITFEHGNIVETITMGDLLRLQMNAPEETGDPQVAVIAPTYSPDTGQAWALQLHPIPSRNVALKALYNVVFSVPDNDESLLPGGAGHAEAYIESCLSVAEMREGDSSGIHREKFESTLAAAIDMDCRNSAPRTLGVMPSGSYVGTNKPIRQYEIHID